MESRFSILSWDSSFFGYTCGKLETSGTHLSEKDVFQYFNKVPELFFLTVTSDSPLSLEGTTYNERKILYYKETPVEERPEFSSKNILSIEKFDRINELYYLALEAGHDSRFRNDKMMKNFEFEKMYFEWIFKSIQGKFDDKVFVYKSNEEFIGLLTLKKRNDDMIIGLVAAGKKSQGLGIGTQLIKFAEIEARKTKCKNLLVSTQETNRTACSFYEKNSFKVLKETSISHIWRDSCHQKYR